MGMCPIGPSNGAVGSGTILPGLGGKTIVHKLMLI